MQNIKKVIMSLFILMILITSCNTKVEDVGIVVDMSKLITKVKSDSLLIAQADSIENYWHGVMLNIDTTKVDTVWKTKYIEVYPDCPDDTTFIHDTTVVYDTVYIGLMVDPTPVDTIVTLPVDTTVFLPWDPVGPLFQEIPIISIKVDTIYNNNNEFKATNMIDGTLYNSRSDQGLGWSVPGYPHSAMFYFNDDYLVTEVWINTWGWSEDYTHSIIVYNYADTILTAQTSAELWSKHRVFYRGNHLYLDILDGNNNWTDIREIKIFGFPINVSYPQGPEEDPRLVPLNGPGPIKN